MKISLQFDDHSIFGYIFPGMTSQWEQMKVESYKKLNEVHCFFFALSYFDNLLIDKKYVFLYYLFSQMNGNWKNQDSQRRVVISRTRMCIGRYERMELYGMLLYGTCMRYLTDPRATKQKRFYLWLQIESSND